jgi:hypothetical protein
MDVTIKCKKTSDGKSKTVEGYPTGELRVVICGVTAAGVVTPLKCNASGYLLTAAGP